MFKLLFVISMSCACVVTFGLVAASAQDKPAVVVHAFTVLPGVDFPYDMKSLQSQVIEELKTKDSDQFNAASDAPPTLANVYILDGEVLEWHKGNVAERMIIAMGSVAGRENAKIHFWLTDKDGKKVYEQTDIIRQLFMRNLHEKNSGLLAQPFADKIVERLKEAKMMPEGAAAK